MGQGAADAALRYIVLSDSLIDAFHEKFQLWSLPDPTLAIPTLKSLKSFIDDVPMSVSVGNDNFPALVHQAQAQVQWWNHLVKATNGALNPQKCFSMVYTWTPDKFGILWPSPKASMVWACFDFIISSGYTATQLPNNPSPRPH